MLRQKLLACSVVLGCGCGPRVNTNGQHAQTDSCSNENVDLCNIAHDLRKLEEQKIEATKAGDTVNYHTLQLEINYLTELNAIDQTNDRLGLQELDSKYEILRRILDDDIARYEQDASLWSDGPLKAVEMKDIPLEGPDFTSVYHPRVLAEVKRVFKDFGDLYINATVDSNGRSRAQEVRVKKPWSGYWYPFGNAAFLYKGENSPLVKFDKLLHQLGYDSHIAEKERERYKGFTPDGWEGLCDAWALAAVMTSEPKAAIQIHGQSFSIADQKALRTYSHLKYSKIQYGITYRGNAETDGTYQDIKPEAFHRVVTKVLGEEKRPVVIDDMSGVQVWNKPLYRYRWKVVQDPRMDYAFLVRAYPWLVKERSRETDELTNERDTVAPIYTYRLYVDKSVVKDGKYKVIAGQWIGDSFYNHPDSVIYPLPDGKFGSHNSEFNKYAKIYKKFFLDQ